MTDRYFHHAGGNLLSRHVNYIKAAARLMGQTSWRAIAARPKDPQTIHLVDACDQGKTVALAVSTIPIPIDQLIQTALDNHLVDLMEDLPYIVPDTGEITNPAALDRYIREALGMIPTTPTR